MKDKRGVMGLDVAKSFLMILLGLVILGVVFMIVLNELGDVDLAGPDSNSASVTNETGLNITAGGDDLAVGSLGYANLVVTLVDAFNYTDGVSIPLVNITLTSYTITNATAETYNNATISYTYTYTTQSDTEGVIGNATEGTADFFTNTGTWLSLLSIVILILIISVVIIVVGRFGGRGEGSL